MTCGTAATLLLSEGVHAKIVSEMLGHTEIGITLNLYAHVTPALHESASSTLWRLLDRPSADHDRDGPGRERSLP
jgi:integrase